MTKDSIRPTHYKGSNGLEVFDIMEGYVGALKGMQAFYWCNVVKYVLRFQHKNGVEDLKKAQYYLNKLITDLEVHHVNDNIIPFNAYGNRNISW